LISKGQEALAAVCSLIADFCMLVADLGDGKRVMAKARNGKKASF